MGLKLKHPCYEIVYESDDPEDEEFNLICRECWEENDTLPMPVQTYCFSTAPEEYRNQRCDFCDSKFWSRKKHKTKFTLGDIQQIKEEIAKAYIRQKEKL